MELNEQLIQAITKAVVEQLQGNQPQPHNSEGETLAGKTRMRPMHSYEGAEKAPQGTDPKEIVIGVGAAFQTEIRATICGIPLEEVLRNVQAGIEEEGMTSRVVMDLDTYRKIGRNAAKYVKGEKVTPFECTNDPMVRAKFQVKAALMHIIETEQLQPEKGMIVWEGAK